MEAQKAKKGAPRRGTGGDINAMELDSILVDRLTKRDETALADVQRLHFPAMRGIGRNIGISAADVEECANDTLLEVWESIPPAKPDNLRSFCCMIMRRRAIDRVRYNTAGRRGTGAYVAYDEICDELSDAEAVEEKVVSEMTLTSLIESFLDGLSRKEREIFLRRYYAFENVNTICIRTGLKRNTVDKILSRLRVKLKKRLEKEI
ncbi:MAG: sigma-70 family RNA polymerase sigma factor [Clostridia bacterium]|nr:sigma-70 family RNA polymerase sigma factor [Clostridia bacterium]